MNLNDLDDFKRLDPENMLAHIDSLPDQLESAWKLGTSLPLPAWKSIRQVIIAGMGGSAIGGDLAAAYVEPDCRVPVVVQRCYDLPGWAGGSDTLLIASSHSGNTEETLSAFSQARSRGCRILAICTGGALAEQSRAAEVPLWFFQHQGQPRTAVGYSFALILAALTRMDLVPDPAAELEDALSVMRTQQESIRADVPDVRNSAKRMAGQLVNRWVAIAGAQHLAPVARRWKGQVSEVAKAWAQFEELPEMDHNSLAGTQQPAARLSNLAAIFLRAPSLHPRNLLRTNLTKQAFMLQGIGTDFIDAQGTSRLAHQWSLLHYGDYVSYYLAMAYGVDPTPIETIENFKQEMALAERSAG